jgi:hypothetical protein
LRRGLRKIGDGFLKYVLPMPKEEAMANRISIKSGAATFDWSD